MRLSFCLSFIILFGSFFFTVRLISEESQKIPNGICSAGQLHVVFQNPPKEFSLIPWWFWNDQLDEKEMVRQLDDFERHGIYGFTIHIRIGVPLDMQWLDDEMIRFMRFAIEEAAKRDMKVILYDEGMYPSGSSCGQVVATNPEFAARGLTCLEVEPGARTPAIVAPDWKLITESPLPNGKRALIYDRPSGGVIRGIHYIDEGLSSMSEEEPLAADILNPEAVDCYIQLVYDQYYREFGKHFGKTVMGIFTDEPTPMGRAPRPNLREGQSYAINRVSEILGYDFKPHLVDLWHDGCPDAAKHRADYQWALHQVLTEVYYERLAKWCEEHGTQLMGHPGPSNDIGAIRPFHVPGQDLVWRMVVPGESAFSLADSMVAKAASSVKIHMNRRRCLNELYGAYGHELTFEEVKWLANWCFVRGHDLLQPHAFYYSMRGPRRDERPPDVGPNSSWWNDYKPYADSCRRLSWLNADSQHVCSIAVLAASDEVTAQGTRSLFENQLDFNYLEFRHLWEDAKVDEKGVHIAGMHYEAIILPPLRTFPPESQKPLETLAQAGRLVRYTDSSHPVEGAVTARSDEDLVEWLKNRIRTDIQLEPVSINIRVRHVVKNNVHFYLLFNEVASPVDTTIQLSVDGKQSWWDTATSIQTKRNKGESTHFEPFEMKILCVE